MNRTLSTSSVRVGVVFAALMLAGAACSGAQTEPPAAEDTTTADGSSPTQTPSTGVEEERTEGELRELTIGSIPIALLTPLVHAQNNGWFAEEGVTVTLDTGAASGAANLTQVVSGDFDIGLSDVPSVMLAINRGLGIQGIAPASGGGSTPETTYSAVGVAPGSSIASPEDLQGTTVAVNALNNVSDITIKGSLEQRGIDSSTVTFVEVPLPEIPAAILEGRVDAGLLLEPFLGLAISRGVEPVLFNYVDTVPDGTIAVYFTTTEFAEENADVVASFKRAMDRATAFMAENPEEVRALVPTFTQIPPEAAVQMRLPVFEPEALGPEAVENLNDLMVELGLLDDSVPLEDVCLECWE